MKITDEMVLNVGDAMAEEDWIQDWSREPVAERCIACGHELGMGKDEMEAVRRQIRTFLEAAFGEK